jgi:micrococcal nuclease
MILKPAVVALVAGALLLPQELTAPVTRVIDGDTIEVEIDGRRERVRYIGMDTPEMNDARPVVRDLARAASAANARLVADRQVRLELDVEKRDRYGRLLAYVWVGDTMVNEALVLSGHAAPYTFPPNVRYVERFVAAAREARSRQAPEPPVLPEGSISAVEAAAHIGDTATVCGYVASARYLDRGRRPTFLNLEAPYPDQAFTVVIWGQDRRNFPNPPVRLYRNRNICVTGSIEAYRGKPQIVVAAAESIRIR